MTDSLVDDVEDHRPGDDEDVELSLNLPVWLTAGLERRRAAWTRVDAAALLGIAVHLALAGIVLSRGSYYLDDLRAQAATVNRSLADFVLHPVAAPFVPLPRLLTWLITDRFGLRHGPAVIAGMAVRGVLAVAFWRLLRRLTGPRPVVLLPLGVLLLTPALLPVSTWFQASITVLAGTAFAVWAADAFLSWLQEGRRRCLVTVAVTTLLAGCCHLLGIGVPVLLLVLVLTLLAGAGGSGRRAAAGIAVSAGASAAVLVGYLTLSGAPTAGLAGGVPADAVRVAGRAVFGQLLPSLLGGPLRWSYPRPYAGTPDPAPVIEILVGLAVAVGLGYVALHRPARALRALGCLVGLAAPAALVAATTRTDAVGPLFTPADAVAAVLVPFALLAGTWAAIGSAPSGRGPSERAPSNPGAAAPADRGPGVAGPTRGRRRAAADGPIEIGSLGLTAALVTAAVLAGSLVSAVGYTRTWWDNPTGNWLVQVRNQMTGAEAYPRIVATPFPTALVPAGEARILPSSAPLLQVLRPDVRFHDADGQVRALSATGVLAAPYVVSLGASKKAPLCVATIPEGRRSSRWVRLTKDVTYVPGAQLAIGLLAGASGRIEVSMRTPDGTTLEPVRYSDDDLPAGPHRMNVPVPYGRTVSAVKVSTEQAARTCISSVGVWAPYL